MAITIEHAGSLALDCIDAKTGEFDKKKFHDLIPGALLPDMARSLFIKAKDVPKGTTSNDSPNPEVFGMTRKALHFEMSQDGKDCAWIEFPSDMKAYTPERILAGLKYHVPENQKPCAIGEPTNIKAFEDHNQKLKSENPSLYEGLMYHYRYDAAHDGWKNPEDPEDKCGLREMLDDGGEGRLDGKFMYQGEDIGAKGVRTLASDLSQDGILYLSAQMTNKSHGKMRLNNDFIEKNVKPALYDAFDKDFADSGLKYMHVDEKVEEMEKEQNGKFFPVYSDADKEWFDNREKHGTMSFDAETDYQAEHYATPVSGMNKNYQNPGYKTEHIEVPLECVKGPFTSVKNGEQYDVVSVPLGKKTFGKMTVADNLIDRDVMPGEIVMGLSTGRQRNVHLEDGSVKQLYPQEIGQKFDDFSAYAAKRNEKGILKMRDIYDAAQSEVSDKDFEAGE